MLGLIRRSVAWDDEWGQKQEHMVLTTQSGTVVALIAILMLSRFQLRLIVVFLHLFTDI